MPAAARGCPEPRKSPDTVLPKLIGTTSLPDAAISLYATASGSSTPILIGTGTSNAAGAWSITANQSLANGSYAITAVATDPSGQATGQRRRPSSRTSSSTRSARRSPPSRSTARVRLIAVTFQDYGGSSNAGGGLDMTSLVDAPTTSSSRPETRRSAWAGSPIASVTAGTTAGHRDRDPQGQGKDPLRGGRYSLRIDSESTAHPRGSRTTPATRSTASSPGPCRRATASPAGISSPGSRRSRRRVSQGRPVSRSPGHGSLTLPQECCVIESRRR